MNIRAHWRGDRDRVDIYAWLEGVGGVRHYMKAGATGEHIVEEIREGEVPPIYLSIQGPVWDAMRRQFPDRAESLTAVSEHLHDARETRDRLLGLIEARDLRR